MNQLNKIALLFILGVILFSCSSNPGNQQKSEKVTTENPNIVFILVDDLGYGDIGCFGQEKIQTPAIDKLAEEGIKFTESYAGNAVCAPCRSTLMQGV
ncbi:MAG: sulfatase-like hydrolase/transferase, partial [Draconibacterium sp.]|nr:sulfatase-like hydrolase/transferase [Draconibacterium sp.]